MKLIFHAKVADKTVKAFQTELYGKTVYRTQVTGGKWDLGTFWSSSEPITKRLEYPMQEIAVKHPYSKWHIILGQDIFDRCRSITEIWLENQGYNNRFALPKTAVEIMDDMNSLYYVRPTRTLAEVQTALDNLVTQGIFQCTTGPSNVYYKYLYKSERLTS